MTLLFSHPEIWRDISNKGLPIVSSAPFTQQTHDQLNHRWDFTSVADYLRKAQPYSIVDSGDVQNYITRVMKLTRGKLLRQDDWSDWQNLEYLQLDQYDAQAMFGSPVAVESNEAVFNLVVSGHMASRQLMVVRKLDAHVMGLHSRDKFVSWMRHMLIVSTRPVLVYSMVLQRLKTSLFMVLMCQMHLRRLLPLNKDFTSDLIELFKSGGQSIRNVHRFPMAT